MRSQWSLILGSLQTNYFHPKGFAKDRSNRTYRRSRVCRRRVQIPRVSQHTNPRPHRLIPSLPLDRRFEKECQALQKDSKTYSDSMRGESVSRQATRHVEPLRCESDICALAMTSAQARLAESIETFYGASDRTSDGAMAGHAFKSAVEELDNSAQREMVCHDFFVRTGYCPGSVDVITF